MGVLTLKQQKGELCYFMSQRTAAVPTGLVSPACEQTPSYPSPLLLGLTLGYLQLLPARVHSS